MGPPGLARFFRPRNVALVGASDKSEWSRVIHSRFAQFGHEGKLFAVNRQGAPAHGMPGFRSCAEIPEPVDMAYVFVPATAVAQSIREAAAAGIPHAVVLTSGFAEVGPEGKALQDDVAAAARESGVRMMGPNSMGFANIAARCITTAINTRLPIHAGRLAIVSQSGALSNELGKFAHTQRIGLSFIAATGNEAQIGIADVVDYLVDDEATGAIALYVESINDPAAFVAAARRARAASMPIVMLKLGRSPMSAAIAQAHTGSLLGDDRVFDAMCRRNAIVRVGSLEELVVTGALLQQTGPIDPPRVGMVSLSGGACGMYAELADEHGLAVEPWSEATRAELRAVLPAFATTLNPLDITGAVSNDPSIWLRALPVLHRDPSMGVVTTFTVMPNTRAELVTLRPTTEAIAAACRAAGARPLVGGMFMQDVSEAQAELARELGLGYVLPNIDLGVRALAHLQRWSERLRAEPAPAAPPSTSADRPLGERATLAFLASQGVPVIPARLARSADEAAAAVEAIGGPVALKIASPEIHHKTEAGGVRLGVRGAVEAREAFGAIMAAARAHAPGASLEGVLVSPMRVGGLELIVGVARDPEWGPAIAVGLGGTLTEALDDTQVRLLPVGIDECREMLRGLRGARLLQGFRGEPPADLARLAGAIVAIGRAALALGDNLAALEVNPLRVHGAEIEALDGLAIYTT